MIASIKTDGKHIFCRFTDSKQGISFDSLAQLKAAIAIAKERAAQDAPLLELAAHLEKDPELKAPETFVKAASVVSDAEPAK